ncbi:MAG TPA: SDR family oxidoreductase, partial [Burkholderiales bacterium]|nr:SDR family oxidoreductase [Burkholderiales bacterium]
AAICNALSTAGATVVVADINLENARAVARDVGAAGGQARALQVDIGAEDQVQQAIAETLKSYGRLDALINNAGIDFTLPIDELSVEQWDAVVRTNLRGPFLLCKYASTVMRRLGGGHIVNIASTAARRAWPNASAYHASKWALLGLSHALHAELRPHGIKVSAVIAGGMRTPFLLDRFPDLDPGVLQDPANVAATVCFLLTQPAETVIPEVMVLPMRETSWP